jgi:hypothetical protein
MYLIELGRLKPNFQLGRLFMTCTSDAFPYLQLGYASQVFSAMKSVYGLAEEAINIFPPADFNQKYFATHIVFHGIENPFQKHRSPAAQQITFSV